MKNPHPGLVVEVDGDTHAANATRDAQRDAWLGERGFGVLRFSNRDVVSNLEGVLLAIAGALAHPHPGPLPEGEGVGWDGRPGR